MAGAVESSRCLFCKIAGKNDPSTELLFEDEGFVVFRDIKPAASHHYLIVPKRHIASPKLLGIDDKPLVEELIKIGRTVLEKQGGDLSSARFGFHWPPFTSVSHLHLHAICPISEMGFMARMIFRPNSWWFVTADWLLDHLSSKTQ